METFFDNFIKNYDINNPRLNYKYYHSYRVMDDMYMLAKSQKLSPDDIELAKFIGLFHDIGRFIQYEQVDDFNDILLDHGDIGVAYLKELKALNHCHISKKNYQVVYKAIKNHNKFEINNSLNARELLFTKLIRDADKIDILYALSNKKLKPKINEEFIPISENVKKHFFEGKPISKGEIKNKNDRIIVVFSFIFDIQLNTTFKIIKKNNYYNKIYKRLKNKEIFKPYIEYTNKYINERTDKKC